MDYEIEYDAARKMTVAAVQLCRDAEEYRVHDEPLTASPAFW